MGEGGSAAGVLWGHVNMMSALGGGPPKADDSTDKLRECDNDKGGVGQKIRKFCRRHMNMPPMCGGWMGWDGMATFRSLALPLQRIEV